MANDKIDPPDSLCNWIANSATGSFRDVLRNRVREATTRGDWRVIRALIWDGADPVWTRNTQWHKQALQEALNRDLVHASAIGDGRLISKLIHAGADVNVKAHYDENMSPLIWAARCDHAAAVRLLLSNGADVDIAGDFSASPMGMVEGSTPLIWAASYGNLDVIKVLLAKGANPNAQETVIYDINKPGERQHGNTPLLESANRTTMELLLEAKADPNEVGLGGISPLMKAALAGDLDRCKLLLAWGANPLLKDFEGHTAADLAEKAGHPVIAELLRGRR